MGLGTWKDRTLNVRRKWSKWLNSGGVTARVQPGQRGSKGNASGSKSGTANSWQCQGRSIVEVVAGARLWQVQYIVVDHGHIVVAVNQSRSGKQ